MAIISERRKKEIFEDYYNSEEVFDKFVEHWIEKNEDEVFDIIKDYLESNISRYEDELAEYVEDKIEGEISDEDLDFYQRVFHPLNIVGLRRDCRLVRGFIRRGG